MTAPTTDQPEPVTDPPAGPNRRLVLAGAICAAIALGGLFNVAFIQLRGFLESPLDADTGRFEQLYQYTSVGATIGGLLLLRLFPRRGWSWLLAAGSVLAMPLPMAVVDEDLFANGPAELLTVMVVASTSLVMLGALGAAVWVWTALPGAAVALAGASIVLPLAGNAVILLAWFGDDPTDIRPLIVGSAAVGLLGAAGAVAVATAAGALSGLVPRAGWRVTGCAMLAAPLPMLLVWLEPRDFGFADGQLDRFYLVAGIAVAVPGVVLALVAGWRVGAGTVTAALAGVALSVLGIGIASTLPADHALTLPAVLAGVVIGWLVGITRWRVWFAVAGFAICGIVSLVTPDSVLAVRSPSGSTALAIALLVVIAAAAVAAIAAAATVPADASAIPALGSLALVVQAGLGPLFVYLIWPGRDALSSPTAGIGALLLVTTVPIAAIGAWQARRPTTR